MGILDFLGLILSVLPSFFGKAFVIVLGKEVDEGKCRFRECLHDREPGCAVTEAVNQGELNHERVERYRQLLEETREVWRNRYD